MATYQRPVILAPMRSALAVALGFVSLLCPALAPGASGSFTRHRHAGLDYWLSVPGSSATGRPLVVFLHGCGQEAGTAAGDTGWRALAEAKRFIAVFPQAPPITSTLGCWWFTDPVGSSSRGQGQAGAIAAVTRHVSSEYRVDRRRVYLDGYSAGGTMASVMGATYPDLYAAIAEVEGAPYMGVDDTGALAYAAMGSHARPLPVLLISGTQGGFAFGGEGALRQWLLTDDRADDGSLNGSIPQTPAQIDVGTSNRFDLELPWTREQYNDSEGSPLIERWVINGMFHEYPGPGNSLGPGLPDATTGAWAFFAAHPFG
jgi:poly(hydroxyalkanoate) depolymerase family esterase